MSARYLGLAALALSFVVGCSTSPVSNDPSISTISDPPAPTVGWEHPSVDAQSTPGAAPIDYAGGPKPPPSRAVRRMRIDTLQAAMSRVAGKDVYGAPIAWMVNGNNGFSDLAFGKALGRPDFQTSTEESGVSSALYMKFVGDASRDICMQMAKNDLKRTDATTRSLFPKAPVDGTATDAQKADNLRYLVLRFEGLRVEAADPMIPALRAVFDAGESSVKAPLGGELVPAAEGWRGVCVALFESPLFHND
jgi:hypothetical protein